jgi:CheY-like chemotaxis protein
MEHRTDATTAREPSRQTARVFLGEDDRELRWLMVEALRGAGHRVIEASNGLDLLRWIQLRRAIGGPCDHDLVVTEAHMPGASGLEVLATVRRSQPGLPVVLLAAVADAALRASARDLGVAAIFDKPFSMAALHAAVQSIAVPGFLSLAWAESWIEMPGAGGAWRVSPPPAQPAIRSRAS